MHLPKTRMMDYGCPIRGESPCLTGDGACQGHIGQSPGQSPLDCGGAEVAASGTARQKPTDGNLGQDPACVRQAIAKLKSLQEGFRGIIEVVTCGNPSIPALRALLFEREPSGLYQPRCLAVRALAALDAYDVLIEYLNAPREVADPVERVGEDAVINAVAYALAGLHEERILELLLKLAETRILLGVILALGGFGRIKTIPFLVEALADDECRPAAEAALRKFGTTVREALLVAATACSPPVERESDSSLRRRRSALALLIEIGIRPETWPLLRRLMQDKDSKIAVLACKICLMSAIESEKGTAIQRLIRLLPNMDFVLTDEIEQCLALVM